MTKIAITGAATDSATIRKIADEAFTALNRGGGQVLPFSRRYPAFGTDDAYRVTALVNNMRVAQRYKPLGRKIGFTNRRMWDEYGIHAPIWGYVYDRTMQDLAVRLPLAPYTGWERNRPPSGIGRARRARARGWRHDPFPIQRGR